MILDSSAVVAVMNGEPESAAFVQLLEASDHTSMSTASALEVHLVMRPARAREVTEFLTEAAVELVPFDEAQLDAARTALASYGRGSRHPAKLNFGDCMAYALAKVTGQPLFFKGDDFSHTDVEPAYRP